MENKKIWWDMFAESKKSPKVQEFIKKMSEFGASGGPQVNCFVYHKNDIVLVANYRPFDQAIIGSIMTVDVYDDMMLCRREISTDLPGGYFAWAYKYGYDYMENNWDAFEAFKYFATQGPTAATNHIGNCNQQVMYLVKDYVDRKPKGECGVCDEFYLVGLFNNILDAEKAANASSKEESEYPHTISIMPVFANHAYQDDKPMLGGSWHIE